MVSGKTWKQPLRTSFIMKYKKIQWAVLIWIKISEMFSQNEGNKIFGPICPYWLIVRVFKPDAIRIIAYCGCNFCVKFPAELWHIDAIDWIVPKYRRFLLSTEELLRRGELLREHLEVVHARHVFGTKDYPSLELRVSLIADPCHCPSHHHKWEKEDVERHCFDYPLRSGAPSKCSP